MGRILKWAHLALPFAYLLLLVMLAVEERTKINDILINGRDCGAAIEDIIGFGAAFSWGIFVVPLLALCTMLFVFRATRDPWYWRVLIVVTVIVGTAGFYFGRTLDDIVINGDVPCRPR